MNSTTIEECRKALGTAMRRNLIINGQTVGHLAWLAGLKGCEVADYLIELSAGYVPLNNDDLDALPLWDDPDSYLILTQGALHIQEHHPYEAYQMEYLRKDTSALAWLDRVAASMKEVLIIQERLTKAVMEGQLQHSQGWRFTPKFWG